MYRKPDVQNPKHVALLWMLNVQESGCAYPEDYKTLYGVKSQPVLRRFD
jgi:hypothetical protein